MRVPIFEACFVDTTLQGLIGGAEFRLYQFGEAPQDCKLPYVVWGLIYGSPFNSLNDIPDVDSFGIQIDVYGPEHDPKVSRNVARAMRNVVEIFGYVVNWNGESRDPDTRNYRVSFDVDWIVERT